MSQSTAALIARHLAPGMRIAIADGAGAPTSLADDLTEAARSVGGVSLLLGWCLDLPVHLDPEAFPDIRTVMGGFALKAPILEGKVRRIPERLSALPALLTGPLRPDVLVAGLTRDSSGLRWGTEVSWMGSVVDSGVKVLVEENAGLPSTSCDPTLPADQVFVVKESDRPPIAVGSTPIDERTRLIGRHVAALIPEGACLQYGPGALADAIFELLEVPVRIRSGMINQSVLRLVQRGLLLDDPLSTYVVGNAEVYDWADGRGITTHLGRTHHLAVADGYPFITINTALEVDRSGAVNVEGASGEPVAGVGGHPDFALAGHQSIGGMSVIATPTSRQGKTTLVENLSFPASTLRSDVDIVVTEHGTADLRGLDDTERAVELDRIWNAN